MKNIKIISLLSCTAIFLLTIAILTVSQTFSLTSEENDFDIKLSTDNENTIIDGTKLDFYNTIKEGDTYSFDVTVSNVGNIDAELRKVIRANLNDYEVATSSKTNKTYTLSDYLNYNIYYAESNDDNDVNASDRVKAFDSLKVNTSNKIRVEVKFDKQISEDAEYALKEVSEDSSLKVSLYFDLDFTNK